MTRRTVEKFDRSGKTPSFLHVPGENGAVEISEINMKRCFLGYYPDYISVKIECYDTTEEELFPRVNQNSLAAKKKSLFGCAAPQLDEHYKDFSVAPKLIRLKLNKKEELNIVFALESIKSKLEYHNIDLLEIDLDGITEDEVDGLKKLLDKLHFVSPMKLEIPIIRLHSMMPAIDSLFDYDHLICRFQEDMDHPIHLTEKMIACKYLCIQAQILNPDILENFPGWGLHLMTVQDGGGLDLSFVTKEIKNWCSGRKVSRKLTALTREELGRLPWLFDEQELAEILRIFEEAKIDSWVSVDGNFTNRVYTKSNGNQAALITESKKEGRFNSLAFIQPYDVMTYKFIRGGQTSYYK